MLLHSIVNKPPRDILCFDNSRILGEDLASKINYPTPLAADAARSKALCSVNVNLL